MRGPLPYSCPMETVRIGYARCSTDRQDLTAQRLALIDLGVDPERIYTDHGLTGRTRARPGLDQALAAVRAGDTLVVTKLDRLARSVPDAREIADQLLAREAKLALGPTTHDPNDPMGKMFFNILATFADPRCEAGEGNRARLANHAFDLDDARVARRSRHRLESLANECGQRMSQALAGEHAPAPDRMHGGEGERTAIFD